MPTHTISTTYQTAAGSIVGTTIVTNTAEVNVDETLSPAATNVECDVTFTRAQMKSLCLYCTGDCTVKTNTTGGSDTVVLAAGVPVIWQYGVGTNPFGTADITKLFLSSTAGGSFQMRAILAA